MDDSILHSYIPPVGEKLELYKRLEAEISRENHHEAAFFIPPALQDPQEWKNFSHWRLLKTVLDQQINEEYLSLRAEAQKKGMLEKFLKNYSQLTITRPQFEAQGTLGMEEFLQKLRDLAV
jgi:hypothetical protein